VALSANGTIVAAGYPKSGYGVDGKFELGYVQVYRVADLKSSSVEASLSSSAWQPFGQEVTTTRSGAGSRAANSALFGTSIALSGMGTTLIVGDSTSELRDGRAQVYELVVVSGDDSDNFQQKQQWVPKGPPLNCNNIWAIQNCGIKVASSHDGNIVAVGGSNRSKGDLLTDQIRFIGIYRFNRTADSWDLMGQALDGRSLYGSTSMSSDIPLEIALSADGLTVAIAGNYKIPAVVYAFNVDKNEWIVKGDNNDNGYVGGQTVKEEGLYFGALNVAINANGTQVAVLGIDPFAKAVFVRVYGYNEDSHDTDGFTKNNKRMATRTNEADNQQLAARKWQQIHSDINVSTHDASLALSGDGNVLVVGEPTYINQTNDGITDTAGQIRIFVWRSKGFGLVLTQKGNESFQFDGLGEGVATSFTGDVVAARSSGYYDHSDVSVFVTP